MLEERTVWAKRYRVQDIIHELSISLRNELDYLMEGRSGERIAKQFQQQMFVRVPTIYWDYTTKSADDGKVNGIKVSDVDTLDAEGYDRHLIAKRLADAMFAQILDKGFSCGSARWQCVYFA